MKTQSTIGVRGGPSFEVAIPGGVLRLGADSRDQLCALSLLDGAGRDMLEAPGPVILVDGRPVRITAVETAAMQFAAPGITGELDCAGGVFQLSLRNTTAAQRVVRLEAPVFAYVSTDATRVFHPGTAGRLAPCAQSVTSVYPGGASVCALFFTEFDRSGFGFGYFNGEQRRVVLENGPQWGCHRMRAVFERVPLPADGAPVRLPRFYVAVGHDWDELLAPYARYAAQTFPARADTPDWVTAGNWVIRKLRIHPFDLDRLPELERAISEGCRAAKARGVEPVFWIEPWWQSCERLRGRWYFDHVQGDFTVAPPLVERVVREVHRRGARIVAYANVTALGEYSDLFQTRADEVLVRDQHGAFVRNMEYPMFMYCPASDGARELWDRVVDFMLGELRLDGIFLDQAGGGSKAPECHNPAHGHAQTDCYGPGLLELLARIRARAKAINPQAVIFGELAEDARDHLMDFWLWHWEWSGVVRQPAYAEGACFFKYVRPAAVLLDQSAAQYPDELEAARALGRGVWVNVFDGSDWLGGHCEAAREFYQRHRHLLQTPPRPLRTDSPDVAAVLFGPLDGRALVGFLQPRHAAAIPVGVWLPAALRGAQTVGLWTAAGLVETPISPPDADGRCMIAIPAGGGVAQNHE